MSDESLKQERENCPPETPVSYSTNRTKRHQLFRLEEAFHAINEDTELAKEFVESPLEVLKKFDVNTTNLKINKSKYGAKIPAMDFGGVYDGRLSWTVCASIGLIVCATVGDDI